MLTSLIISADQPLVWTVEPALRQLEFAVTVKQTLVEGAESFWHTRYNALVVDCADHGLDGLRQERHAPLNRESMLIAVTAAYASHKPAELADAGADAIWHRPLVAAEIFQTLVSCRGIATGDRRLYRRQQLDRAVFLRYSYNGQDFFESVIVDVNESGIAIEGLEAVAAGRALLVEFALPAMLSPILAVADVVWRTDAGRAGLRFLQMSEANQRQLERWLRTSRLGIGSRCSCVSSRA